LPANAIGYCEQWADILSAEGSMLREREVAAETRAKILDGRDAVVTAQAASLASREADAAAQAQALAAKVSNLEPTSRTMPGSLVIACMLVHLQAKDLSIREAAVTARADQLATEEGRAASQAQALAAKASNLTPTR